MIIEADGKFYRTTYHTDEKMFLLNIDEETVREVIENGDFDVTDSGDDIYRLVTGKREIAVVIVDDDRIKTVYIVG